MNVHYEAILGHLEKGTSGILGTYGIKKFNNKKKIHAIVFKKKKRKKKKKVILITMIVHGTF